MESKSVVVYKQKNLKTRPRSELARSVHGIAYLTQKEYEALLEVSKTHKEHQLLIALLWQTGMRVSEALALTRDDIDFDGINILDGKGHKQRFVPCQSEILGKLSRYQKSHGQDKVFVKLTTEVGVLYMLRRYAKQAGITKRIYPHLFRHSFAINFLRQRFDPFSLQDIGGWSDMETIKIYIRLAKESPRQAIANMYFPEIPE